MKVETGHEAELSDSSEDTGISSMLSDGTMRSASSMSAPQVNIDDFRIEGSAASQGSEMSSIAKKLMVS